MGVTWSIAIDELMIDQKFIAREANMLNPTKRHLVSIAIVCPRRLQILLLMHDFGYYRAQI